MSVQAELLNVIYYNNKKTGNPMTWLRYRLLSDKSLVDTNKMVGFSIIDEYIPNQSNKDCFIPEHFGVVCEITYCEKQVVSNPLQSRKIIKSIKFGEKDVYNLV